MGRLGAAKRGMTSSAQQASAPPRYPTMPRHSWYGPHSPGGTAWWLGVGRSGAPGTSRGLEGRLAEVVDPAEANKLLLQLGRQVRLTHLQVQAVVKKAGPSGLRLTNLPAAFLKEHNAVLDLRSLGLVQIRELIAGMGRTLRLEADDEDPLTLQEAAAGRTGSTCRAAHPEKRSLSLPPVVAAVAGLAPDPTEETTGKMQEFPSQRAQPGGGVHEHPGLQGGTNLTADLTTSLDTPQFFALDEDSCLILKLGEPLPPVMKELLQHLLISLVADALHHASPPTFAASPTNWPLTRPHAGLLKPPTPPGSLVTATSPEALSPEDYLLSESPEVRAPSLKPPCASNSPDPTCFPSPTENMRVVPQTKETERDSGVKGKPGAPRFAEGTGNTKFASPSYGKKNKGIPIHILPALWQLKYGLRCNLSAMLETCGYTSLRAFIVDELPSLHISPAGSLVTLRLTPTSPRSLAPEALATLGAAAGGKQVLQDDSKAALQTSGSAPPAQPNTALSLSRVIDVVTEGRDKQSVITIKELISKSPLDTNGTPHPTIEAVATAAAAAVQASGVSLPTLLAALSSAARRQAGRGADPGPPTEGGTKCGGRPHALGSVRPTAAASKPRVSPGEAPLAGSSGAKEGAWPPVEGSAKSHLPSPVTMETILCNSAYSKQVADTTTFEESLSSQGLSHSSPNAIQETAPPESASRLFACKERPPDTCLVARPQSQDLACVDIDSDTGVTAQKSPAPNKKHKNKQLPGSPPKCGQVSRLHLHRMLYEAIAMGCEKRGRRWARGEDLIELEEELQQYATAALRGKEIASSKLPGGQGRSSPSVSDEPNAPPKPEQTKEPSSDLGFSSSLPSACQKGGEKNGRLEFFSPRATLQTGDRKNRGDNSTEEDTLEETGHNGTGYTLSSAAVKDDETDGEEKKTETEVGNSTPEAREEAEPDDARLQRRRMKKREKKEKKKRKKERLRALDEHEQEQKRLLSLMDLLQLPSSPPSAPRFSPETPSPFSLAGDEEIPISPFSLASPSRGQTHSCDTATQPSTLNQLLGSCGQSSTALRNETTKIVPVLHVTGTSDAAASASLAVRRLPGESISSATPSRLPMSQVRLSLSPEELATELQSYHNRAVGMLVSAIKVEWERHFGPQTPSLQAYMDHFQVRQLKALLLEVPNLLILGCGGKMRVSTLEHAMQFCNPFPPPSTVFISSSGKKVNLPLTMTPTSPLPWFRAHAYTHGEGSGCASALPHLKQLTVPDVAAVQPSQGEACGGGETHEEREQGYTKHHGGRDREARLRDDKARGDEGQRGTGNAPMGTYKRGKAQCRSMSKRFQSGDSNGADLRRLREGDREHDNATAISPLLATRPGPPQHAVNSVEALPLSAHCRRAPSRRLGPGSGGDCSPSSPFLVAQSASHQRKPDDMAEGQHVSPRQPGFTCVWDNQAGPSRYGLVSQKAQPPHGPSLTTSAEPHRHMREDALETLWKTAMAVQPQRGTGVINPFSASESFYTVPPPGLNRSPPSPPPVQPLPPATTSHDSSPPSMLPRPPAEGGALSNPWDSSKWLSPSPSQTEIQCRALGHVPKLLPPNTLTDLGRLLVGLLLMDSVTGNAAAAVAGLGSAPEAPEEPAGYGPVSALLPLLTHVKGVQQPHRGSEDLRRQREQGRARENREPKRQDETQRSLTPDVDARRQPPSFQAPCASTLHTSPIPESFTPAEPFLRPPKFLSVPQWSRALEHAEDNPENRGKLRNLPPYSEVHHLFPEPPRLAAPFTASPVTYGSHAMPRDMILQENDCCRARDNLGCLNEEGGTAHGPQRLNLRSHMKSRLTLLENGQMHAPTPGAWHQALPSSFGFSSTAFPSAAVSTHQMQSPGHLSVVAEAFGTGEKQYDRDAVSPQARSMETEANRQPGGTQRATPALRALESQPSGAVRPPLLQTFFQADTATACPSCDAGPAPSGAVVGPWTGNREQQFFAEDDARRKIPERPTHGTGQDADSLMRQMSCTEDKKTDAGGYWGAPSCLSVAPRRDLEHRERVYPGRRNHARAPNCMPHEPLERPVHKNTDVPCAAVDSSPYPPDSDSQDDRRLASSCVSSGEETELGQEIRIGAWRPGASSFERHQRKPQENSNGERRIITRREKPQTRRAGNDIEVERNEHSEASLSRATRGREVGDTGENIKTGVYRL
ncbi:hypothetical protein TGDOM2_264170 [Toxoplasma gondii GAB2-2007-GAL-DOM2]|uniref:HTH OST-type domain-containing protein n=2 Tax=Toxoplasma gondii TaxID=5811 RepID=B9QNS3_TOXGV|nr:hypothetical protein TGVEG_264170 [Toxoplasma gondii VEG]KFG30778.1 hypothetical protein TGDOM2_264170 [Toxoplasma gondii GAB2-2007-GAL-DOM2]KFG34649.1 hypothetical protein TGP89_264170 [Toxoplasma gondii p89]